MNKQLTPLKIKIFHSMKMIKQTTFKKKFMIKLIQKRRNSIIYITDYNSLKDKNKELQQLLLQKKQELEKLEYQNSILQQNNERIQIKYRELIKHNSEERIQIDEYYIMNQQLKENLEQVQAEYQESKEQLIGNFERMKENYMELEKNNAQRIKKTIEMLKNMMKFGNPSMSVDMEINFDEQLKNIIEFLQNKKISSQELDTMQMSQIDTHNSSITKRCLQLERENKSLKQQIDDQVDEMESQNDQLKKYKEYLQPMKQNTQALRQKMQEIKDKNLIDQQQYEEKIESQQKIIKNFNEKHTILQEKYTNIQDKHTKELEKITQNIKNFELQNQTLKEQNIELKMTLQKQNSELQQWQGGKFANISPIKHYNLDDLDLQLAKNSYELQFSNKKNKIEVSGKKNRSRDRKSRDKSQEGKSYESSASKLKSKSKNKDAKKDDKKFRGVNQQIKELDDEIQAIKRCLEDELKFQNE